MNLLDFEGQEFRVKDTARTNKFFFCVLLMKVK